VEWTTSQANPASFAITAQPKAFTFYEQGTETAEALAFDVAGGASPHTFQWYQLVSNNVHVRIGVPVTTGNNYTTALYTPTQVLKGTTRNANNTGFYRFYCVAKDANGVELTSDVAEVAVGCGGKTKEGKWMSFMCFNLGADKDLTIEEQKNYIIPFSNNPSSGLHTYQQDEEDVYGDLFQWGRIPDGHEKRTSAGVNKTGMTASHLANGYRCSTYDTYRPFSQVQSGTSWYANFIIGSDNWNPDDASVWRHGRFLPNDPCAHYKENGDYQEFWHPGPDLSSAGVDACSDAGTSWRIPTQPEWAELYRGGTIFGTPGEAEANTWLWNGGTDRPRGYEIRPDDVTTTLFLPLSGMRYSGDGKLYYQGANAYYWSSTAIAPSSAHLLLLTSGEVNPTSGNARIYGNTVRCIKHQ
jgi:hypothetical protein